MRSGFLAAVLLVLAAPPLLAQSSDRIGPYIVDARGTFSRLKQDPNLASGLAVEAASLPNKSFGVLFGAHFYPWRLGRVTFGIGGELIRASAGRTTDPIPALGKVPAVPGVTVHTHFSSVAPQISFNFGGHEGWSYVSGGIAPSTLRVEREDMPQTDVPTRKTINYGFGARWFARRHVAVSLDVRWYAINPLAATATVPAQPRTTLLILSGGIGLR